LNVRPLAALFWLLLGLVFYTYVGYGLLVALLVRLRRPRPAPPPLADDALPALTLVIAAHNEADYIVAKLENCLALDYPRDRLSLLFVTDGSTDATVERFTAYPTPPGIDLRVLHAPERRGKLAAIKRAMAHVHTPIVVYSDANTHLNRTALRELTRHFADPQVGAVAGEKRVRYGSQAGAEGVGEGVYWRYESRLKQLDADLYTVVGAAGELFALRTALYEEMPDDTIIEDFNLSLRVARRGYRVAYAPAAYAVEGHAASVGEEFKRKVRNASGGVQAILRMPGLLNPLAHGWLTFQYVSHRVLRWTITPLALPLLLVLNGLLARRGGRRYRWLLAGQVAFYVTALLGQVAERAGYRIKLFYIPYYFCVMNCAVYAGMWRLLWGRQSAVWERTRRADTAPEEKAVIGYQSLEGKKS
jgi:biofilm PGA synthesis N-glycosyltransferase PgaC